MSSSTTAGTCSALRATDRRSLPLEAGTGRIGVARTLLIRGLVVGLVAGLVAFAVGWLVVEPSLARAIAFEGAHDSAHARPGQSGVSDPVLIGRTMQSTMGLLTATAVYGVALGGVFALVIGFAGGRAGNLSARAVAGIVALVGFAACYLVPFVKYPPNPPGVGDPATVGRRTAAYFILVAASVVLAAAGVKVGGVLRPRLGSWNAWLTATAGYLLSAGAVMAVLPVGAGIPEGFPATTLWTFRTGSLAVQLALWATLGLLFGALTERDLRRAATKTPSTSAATPVG
jgi:hypothetical protein